MRERFCVLLLIFSLRNQNTACQENETMQFLLGTVTVAFSTTVGEGVMVLSLLLLFRYICLPDHRTFFHFHPLKF